MLYLFGSAFVLGLSGAMMPGPLLTYTIRKSLSSGWKAGFVIAAGHGLLEITLIILIFLGFDIVLQSKAAQVGIGIVGGMLLSYMGIDMLISALKNKVSIDTDAGSTRPGSMVVSSVLITAANPYFLIWWAIIGLGFMLQASRSYALLGVIVFYLGHFSADLTWYAFVSILVGKTKRFIKDKPYRIIIASLGILLIVFGVQFIWGALKNTIF
jgi:threonine/homoserine/homoserine lactone efflux protein